MRLNGELIIACERAPFLEAIADQIMPLGEELVLRAAVESGLPLPRLSSPSVRNPSNCLSDSSIASCEIA
jgi:hypothetical protein